VCGPKETGEMRKFLVFMVLLSCFCISPERGFSSDKILKKQSYGPPRDMDLTEVWKAWELIRTFYVDEKRLDKATLTRGLVKGMLYALGDKHGFFFKTDDFKNLIAATHSGVVCEMLVVKNKVDKEFRIGLLKISDFTGATNAEVRQALRLLQKERFSRLIIDLRSNTGGEVGVAYNICGAFLGPDKVVAIKTSRRGEEEVLSVGEKICPEIPVVCLINESTASSAEIVAGALRDHGRAKLVGAVSRGKGSMQTSFATEIGIIMFTTEYWMTPSRTPVEGSGLKPEIKVEKPKEILQAGVDTIVEM